MPGQVDSRFAVDLLGDWQDLFLLLPLQWLGWFHCKGDNRIRLCWIARARGTQNPAPLLSLSPRIRDQYKSKNNSSLRAPVPLKQRF